MTCQSYVVKGQNNLLSDLVPFPASSYVLGFVDNDKRGAVTF